MAMKFIFVSMRAIRSLSSDTGLLCRLVASFYSLMLGILALTPKGKGA